MADLHCWKDKREHMIEIHGWGSDEHAATYSESGDSRNGTCMLEEGHKGDHDFTHDDQIGVTFVADVAPS